jgi:hypothetical protein
VIIKIGDKKMNKLSKINRRSTFALTMAMVLLLGAVVPSGFVFAQSSYTLVPANVSPDLSAPSAILSPVPGALLPEDVFGSYSDQGSYNMPADFPVDISANADQGSFPVLTGLMTDTTTSVSTDPNALLPQDLF